MCLELYQRWRLCDCWGFLGPQTCPELFKKCLGPGGVDDKKVVKWNEGMCNECWERFIEEAREMAAEAQQAEAQKLAAAAGASQHQHNHAGPSFTQQRNSDHSRYARGR
ncbi:hypothetical protein F4802DRAFT_45386 [Xylaria palmicola]|nr:hypothetical protein F4802DRAFT_45386 [Xylaria palmicola]